MEQVYQATTIWPRWSFLRQLMLNIHIYRQPRTSHLRIFRGYAVEEFPHSLLLTKPDPVFAGWVVSQAYHASQIHADYNVCSQRTESHEILYHLRQHILASQVKGRVVPISSYMNVTQRSRLTDLCLLWSWSQHVTRCECDTGYDRARQLCVIAPLLYGIFWFCSAEWSDQHCGLV